MMYVMYLWWSSDCCTSRLHIACHVGLTGENLQP